MMFSGHRSDGLNARRRPPSKNRAAAAAPPTIDSGTSQTEVGLEQTGHGLHRRLRLRDEDVTLREAGTARKGNEILFAAHRRGVHAAQRLRQGHQDVRDTGLVGDAQQRAQPRLVTQVGQHQQTRRGFVGEQLWAGPAFGAECGRELIRDGLPKECGVEVRVGIRGVVRRAVHLLRDECARQRVRVLGDAHPHDDGAATPPEFHRIAKLHRCAHPSGEQLLGGGHHLGGPFSQ